jgi:hypothetical protein
MIAVGFLLTWFGYSVSLWGWCLLRGYDVTLGQLMSPAHPYGSGKNQPWPPGQIGDSRVFPGGTSGTAPATTAPKPGTTAPKPAPGANVAPGNPAPSGRLGPGGTVPK